MEKLKTLFCVAIGLSALFGSVQATEVSSTTSYNSCIADHLAYYGQYNSNGTYRTNSVSGYYKSNGTYVNSYYRS